MARAHCGYQGFMSHSKRPPPILKPGETLETRAHKYHELVDGFEKSGGSLNCSTRDNTVSGTASTHLVASDFKAPDRRGISAKFEQRTYGTKSCQGTTMNRSSYPGFDTATVRRAPPPEWWVKSMQLNDAVNTRQLKSSYQMDLGMAGEKPQDRPFLAKNSTASTTMDLCAGTTKSTYHIPGYSGYIPTSNRNPVCVSQADGEKDRVPVSTLRLYHRHNLPGYAGHNPNNAFNDKGPRYSGMSALTASGSAATGEYLL